MYNAFGGSGGGSAAGKRRLRNRPGSKFSASYGVRNGFMADVERPLAPGEAAKRYARRIPTSFRIRIGEEWHRVAGDVSGGGVLVLYPEQIETNEVEVAIELRDGSGSWRAVGAILRCVPRGERFAHHVRFVDPAQVKGLSEAIQRALDAGETRLATT